MRAFDNTTLSRPSWLISETAPRPSKRTRIAYLGAPRISLSAALWTRRAAVCAAERTKETAVRTTVAAQRTGASADRRTELAADRTVLAAERTYAAWVRTGLMSLAAGVGAKTTLGGVLPEWVVVLTGSVLVAFAAFCFAAAVWRELYPGTPPPRPDVHRLPRALLFALNGFLALVALAALLGVWFGRTGGS